MSILKLYIEDWLPSAGHILKINLIEIKPVENKIIEEENSISGEDNKIRREENRIRREKKQN